MLMNMRSWMSGTGAYIFVGLIVAAFGLSGVGSLFSTIGSTAIVSSGGESIDRYEFEFRLDFEEQQYNQNSGNPVTPEVRRDLAQKLIDEQSLRLLIENTAEEINLDFSVALTGSSHTERTQGLQDMKRDFIYSAVAKSLTPPKVFNSLIKQLVDEKRDISYITIGEQAIDGDFNPTQEAIQSHYDEHKSDFNVESSRSVGLLEISANTLRDQIVLDDSDQQDIKNEYKTTAQDYNTPERRELWQFNFNTEAEAEKARIKLAEENLHVDDLAKELDIKRDGYQVGSVSKEDIVIDAVAEAAFSLESNQVSDLIANGLSYSVIKIGEITPARKQPKKDVIRNITNRLISDKAESLVEDIYTQADDLLISGKTLAEISTEIQLELKTYDTIFADSTTTDGRSIYLPGGQELVDEIFATDVNVENPPFEWQSRGYILYEVTAIHEGYQKTLDDVQEDIKNTLIKNHINEAIAKKAKGLIEQSENGVTLEVLASELGLNVATAKDISRQGGHGFGRDEVPVLFSTKPGQTTTIKRGYGVDHIIARIDRAYVPNYETATFERGVGALKQTLGQTAWQALYKRLKSAYPIEVNQSALDEVLSALDESGGQI